MVVDGVVPVVVVVVPVVVVVVPVAVVVATVVVVVSEGEVDGHCPVVQRLVAALK